MPVLIDYLTKIVYYKFIKTIIDAINLAEIIINIIVRNHALLDFIIGNKRIILISKFWLSLCYL